MIDDHGISTRQACRAARLTRSAFYYARRPRNDGPMIEAIQLYAQENPRHGFDKLYRRCAHEAQASANAGCIGSIAPCGST
jgi:putative transposase